jgi:hypothetical protein
LNFVVTPAGVAQDRGWEPVNPRPIGTRGLNLSTGEAVRRFFELIPSIRGSHPRIYTARFQVPEQPGGRPGTAWKLTGTTFLGEVRPLPANGAPQVQVISLGPPHENADLIIADVRSSRQLVLTTAAALIAEEDPRRLGNIVSAAAPFALGKVVEIARLARARRLARLGRMRAPPAAQMVRGPANLHVDVAIDRRLLDAARQLRLRAGVSLEEFRSINIAIAKVRINGRDDLIGVSNYPGHLLGGGRGFDSEPLIVQHLIDLRRRGARVELVQLYSERIPCASCRRLLDDKFPNAPVFYTIRQERGAARGEALMRHYGLDGGG